MVREGGTGGNSLAVSRQGRRRDGGVSAVSSIGALGRNYSNGILNAKAQRGKDAKNLKKQALLFAHQIVTCFPLAKARLQLCVFASLRLCVES